ncbi:MAG: hypothetical protein QOI20_1287, partial [Acidimicrobiaceae bacterium]|nr:hypothetical protein [Acidimicrobiaceae bacterium]
MSDSGPDELAPAAAPRLFVAVWPRPEVVDALARLPRPDVPGLRWTGPDHWHVTLVFLGASD